MTRVILIEEDRFAEVCDLLEKNIKEMQKSRSAWGSRLTDEEWKYLLNDIHRNVHFHFVTWAQSHGASCVRR